MGSIDLKAMSDAELVSLIARARAVISDRGKVRHEEFAAAVARSLRPARPSLTSPGAQEDRSDG